MGSPPVRIAPRRVLLASWRPLWAGSRRRERFMAPERRLSALRRETSADSRRRRTREARRRARRALQGPREAHVRHEPVKLRELLGRAVGEVFFAQNVHGTVAEPHGLVALLVLLGALLGWLHRVWGEADRERAPRRVGHF